MGITTIGPIFAASQECIDAGQKRVEIAQGGDHAHPLASIAQAREFVNGLQLIPLVYHTVGGVALPMIARIGINIASVAVFPLAFGFSLMRSGYYENFAYGWNKIVDGFTCKVPKQWIKLPQNISERAHDVGVFISKHMGTFIKVAYTLQVVALFALGCPLAGSAMLLPIAYYVCNKHLGLVPRKAALFVERYLPFVTNSLLLMSGNLYLTAVAVFDLTRLIDSYTGYHLQHKVDTLFRNLFSPNVHKCFKGFTPGRFTLEECDQPFQPRPNLSFEDMIRALYMDKKYLELDPGHFNYDITDCKDLPKDGNFDKMMELFERVDWSTPEQFRLNLLTLSDDNRFKDFIKSHFKEEIHFKEEPGISSDEAKKRYLLRLEGYIEKLAAERGITKEQYLAEHLHDLMEHLVVHLKSGGAAGQEFELANAVKNLEVVVPFLKKLSEDPGQRINFETTFRYMAVRGGDYCARGIDILAREMRLAAVIHYVSEAADEQSKKAIDGQVREVIGIYQRLQDLRDNGISDGLLQIVAWIRKEFKTQNLEFAQDTHFLDICKTVFGYGLTTFNSDERRNFGFAKLFFWNFFAPGRNGIYKHIYENNIRDKICEGIGGIYSSIGRVLEKLTEKNTSLSAEQRQEIIDILYVMSEKYPVTEEDNIMQTVLLMMGIYRFKKDAPSLKEILEKMDPDEVLEPEAAPRVTKLEIAV